MFECIVSRVVYLGVVRTAREKVDVILARVRHARNTLYAKCRDA